MSIGGPHEVLPPHGAGAYRTVPVTIDTLPAAERLLRLVAGWRAAVVCVVTPGHPV